MSDTALPLSGQNVYLENIAREDALARLIEKSGPPASLPVEQVVVPEALGRITAGPVYAAISSPHFHASAMDGFAVRASTTIGASAIEAKPMQVGVDAFPVDTGDPLPEGTDTVIIVEVVNEIDSDTIEIEAAVAPWSNVRVAGEDVVEGELLLPPGHRLRPYDLGVMLAAGVTGVAVRKNPVVAIIPTGDELVSPGSDLKAGDLIEFNSVILSAYITEWGGESLVFPIIEDRLEAIEEAVRDALERADVVLVNAGSSAGREDFTSSVVRKLGELLVHGVAIFPGKPTILGVGNSATGLVKPLIGIPGYPVSAVLALQEFVRPLMAHMAGAPGQEYPTARALMSRKSASRPGMEEFLRVKLGEVGGRLIALPAKRGASVISSLVEADGMVRIRAGSEGIEAGEEVEVELLRPLSEVRGHILMAGSHDNALDLLASQVRERHREVSLSTSAVGSMAGLIAVKGGEAHVAGSHLLDPETGDYNWSYIRRYLNGREVVVVNFVQREQGILLPPGNPKGVATVADLAREDVTIVNRQNGAGTRVLLDHLLAGSGIAPADVAGYGSVETTHVAVAMAVSGARADAGLGIYAAAKLLSLEFVSLGWERFDFIFPTELWETPLIKKLIEVLREPAFAESVAALGGYKTDLTGQVMTPPEKV